MGRTGSVQARERIIRERFSEQLCGQCRAHYTSDSVIVLAHRRSVWMVMAACPSCQSRSLFVVSFNDASLRPSDPVTSSMPDFFPNSFLPAIPSDAPTTPRLAVPDLRPSLEAPSRALRVTGADVNAMHEFLQRFDGDFRTIFSSTPPPRDDGAS